jgi:hypothetical protein
MTGSQPIGIIRGVVFSEDGQPAEDVIVSVTSAPVQIPDIAGLTGASGEFTLAAPAIGQYEVTVSYPSGRQESRTVEVTDETTEVTLEVRPGD